MPGIIVYDDNLEYLGTVSGYTEEILMDIGIEGKGVCKVIPWQLRHILRIGHKRVFAGYRFES